MATSNTLFDCTFTIFSWIIEKSFVFQIFQNFALENFERSTIPTLEKSMNRMKKRKNSRREDRFARIFLDFHREFFFFHISFSHCLSHWKIVGSESEKQMNYWKIIELKVVALCNLDVSSFRSIVRKADQKFNQAKI